MSGGAEVPPGRQLTFSNNSNISVPHSPWRVDNQGSIAYKIGYYAWPLLAPAAAPEEGAAEAGGSGLGRALAPKVTAYAPDADPLGAAALCGGESFTADTKVLQVAGELRFRLERDLDRDAGRPRSALRH
ncbi:MAG TPA: hypothetical protein VF070_42515 [Streptosporangiaceae bacterium]